MRKIFVFFLVPFVSVAQFAPPAGQAGTTAMYKDSSAFINWSTACRVSRGLQDISNSSGGFATVGDSSSAVGIANNMVVSLGDGGYAVCTFQSPLTDGPGPDFAVFENSFSDDYLEFGFVEVSSDGLNFFRFPATSNIQDTVQTASFSTSDPTLVNNLAGKYRGLYGTPFDLQELAGTPGLDINNVTHVKIIDAVGSINSAYATYDKNSNKVNDPWPTPFASSGFDLDAVGVIYDLTNSVGQKGASTISVFPNPSNASRVINVVCPFEASLEIRVVNAEGLTMPVSKEVYAGRMTLQVASLPAGIYFLEMRTSKTFITQKIMITP